MIIQPATITEAYRQHGDVYGVQRAWNIAYHLECWARAEAAFMHGSFADFEWLYDHLRRHWQVFRSTQGERWSEQRTFGFLNDVDQSWRTRSLHDIDDSAVDDLWSIVSPMVEIKPVSRGVSIVAISKFLHFWNPRLFVIVDDAVIWRKVFGHAWLWRQALSVRRRLEPRFVGRDFTSLDSKCDLLSYLAILRWSADVVRANPGLGEAFADHVHRHAPDAHCDLPLASYEAAAVEWLLLGLIEIPPPGVNLS